MVENADFGVGWFEAGKELIRCSAAVEHDLLAGSEVTLDDEVLVGRHCSRGVGVGGEQ